MGLPTRDKAFILFIRPALTFTMFHCVIVHDVSLSNCSRCEGSRQAYIHNTKYLMTARL